ncbi:MAG: hypothetical protein HFF80_07655 [Oscillospiraceae bacterium]|jgi:hypothetical protein|nr:hypothetical protein [Oscillospiraceae bacterium]
MPDSYGMFETCQNVQIAFFPPDSVKNFANAKSSCDFLPCPKKKSLALGHSVMYQTSPGLAENVLFDTFSSKKKYDYLPERFFVYVYYPRHFDVRDSDCRP